MKHLTVRALPDDVSAALSKEKQRRGTSLNQTVIDLLRRALGLSEEPADNGLSRFAGCWSDEEYEAFQEAVADLEGIDEDLWK